MALDLFDDELTLTRKTASISSCGQYRYRLTRFWGGDKFPLTFVMLNPSTADANIDDPTIRRCVGFAKREGFAGLVVVNLYAYRATDPEALKGVNDPFGVGNENALTEALIGAVGNPVICAWGTKGTLHGGYKSFLNLASRLKVPLSCLGATKDGHPKHPLYLKADQPIVPYPVGERP